MNQNDFSARLIQLLLSFTIHESLIADLVAILARSGKEEKFLSTFLARVKYLLDVRKNAVKNKEYEPLSHTNAGLYSMHVDIRDYNIRILYAFLPDDAPVLLLGFYEKAGKRRTDYTPHIPKAEQRLTEILKEYDEDE